MSEIKSPAAVSRGFALYTSSRGNYFFHEIRDLIGAGLKELGFNVLFCDERNAFAQQADWHVVIAPHEFFELGAGQALVRQKWPANLVLFNTEQPSTHWITLCARHFARAAAIWDIDFESSLRICKRGYSCDYLPLGYVSNSPMIQEVARLPLHDETRRLTPEIRDRSGFGLSFAQRPIDLLFLGHGSPRREHYFARHADRFKRLDCFFHKPSAVQPMIPGQTTQMNTLTSVGLAQRSKILLNIHHGADVYFEWHRMVLLGIAQRTLVITEPCSIAPPFQSNIDYVEAPLEQLPDRIEYYLGSKTGQQEAQGIIEQGYQTLTRRCRLSDMLRPLVARLMTPATGHVCSATRFFPTATGADAAQARAICVVTPDVTGEGPYADTGSAQVALAEALALAGQKITLLHTEPWYGETTSLSHWRKHFAGQGIEYVSLPADAQVPLDGSEACMRAYETWLWLRRQSFDVVHLPETHGVGFYSLLARKQGSDFQHTLFCLNAHAPRPWRRQVAQQFITNPNELELDFLEQECLRMADALVASSRFMLQWLEQQNWPLPPLRDVRPDPIPARPEVAAKPSDVRELVYLGPLTRCPGLALFCDALDRLGPEALRKITVTFADYTGTSNGQKPALYLQERSAKWTFSWQVANTSSKSILQYLQGKGRLGILPAPMENSPLILRNLLALGLPFLAIHAGGLPELINPADHTGSLCAGKAPALAAALQKAIKDGVVPARPAANAGQIQKWFDWHGEWLAQRSTATTGRTSPAPASTPLVSVCLVHFNRPEMLAQSLASLRAQDYPNFEIVLVDDGSTRPEAEAFLANLEPEFKQRSWRIIRQENSYLGAARNNAARHARGEYLVFMDDDNFAKPNELSTFVRVALKTGAEIVTSSMDLFAGNEPPNPAEKPKVRWTFLGAAAGPGAIRNCFGDANGLVRRDTFLRLGGFTEDYGITHEDWEFYARAVLQGCRMETIPEALFWYRVTDNSMIRSTSQFANLQRSIRPYLAAVPAPLQGLIQYLQGVVCSPVEDAAPLVNHEHLLRLHRRLLTICRELVRAGQDKAAETMFLEVLQSAESSGHPGLLLQTLVDIGRSMIESDRHQIAVTILERAVQMARAGCYPHMIQESQALLATARRGSDSSRNSASRQTSDTRTISKNLSAPVSSEAPTATILPAAAPARSAGAASKPPVVSIIIPTFNKLEFTRKCLVALQQHTPGSTCEIIVVDNASTDGTVEFLKSETEAGNLRAVFNSENLGFSKACNQGARAAAGRHLLFLNNDTEVQPGWLEPLIQTIDSDERVVAVGGKLLFPDRTIQHAGVAILNDQQQSDPLVARHIHYRKPEASPEANQPCAYQALTAACVLMKKTAFDKVCGFDEEYWNGYEDVDLCFKLQQQGGVLVYQPQSVVLHHESQSGPERFRQVAQNIQRLHKKWLGKITPDFTVAADGSIAPTTANKIAPYNRQPAAPAPAASIIILAHNQLDHTRLCLDSIRAHTPLPHELILVDNASTDGTLEYFRSLAAKQNNVVVIRNSLNLGFAAGNNQGLAIAKGECVVLLNNDTVVTADWLEKMLATLQRHPDVGVVGPMSNYVAGRQLVPDAAYRSLDELPKFAAEWSRSHAGQILEIGRVVGFCLLATRGVIDRIGGLDEQFGSGNFEDDDFCLRAGLAGFKICVAQDVFIHHTGSQTFKGAKIDYRESMLRNWKLFKAKWAMPPDAPIENGYSVPLSAPPGLSLKVNLSEARPSRISSPSTAPKTARKSSAPLVLPPCALLGHLAEARELLKKKKLDAAWASTLAAINARPFHPEAALILAEIAQAAGDSVSARHCAQYARTLAPEWKPAKQFLRGNLRGNNKHDWLVLPPAISNPQTKTTPRLSVCLITKNEEKFLAQCLASVRELAAQIVVVDTGSTDRTIEIAKQFNADVHSLAWNDDFSVARNEALRHATGDWVLMIDADEELLPEQRLTILSEMQTASVMAWRLPIIDVGREAEGCSYVPRLFRNAPALFFVGRVHEQIFTSIEVRRQEWGLENRLGKSALLHHGYTKEVVADRNKIERNLRLLKLAVEELPGEPNLVMSLGLELVRSGQLDAGLEQYWQAFMLMSALPAAQVVPELRETLLTQLATHLMTARRFPEIIQLWQAPFATSGGLTASQHFVLGLVHMELKQPAEVAEQMRQCIAKRDRPALSPINAEIRKAGPNHCLALSLVALKQMPAAESAFLAALADDPQSGPARFDFARFRFDQGQPLEALNLLNELVASHSDDPQVWQFGAQIALSQPGFLEFARDWTGEAIQHLPDHPAIILQRAEALLLNSDIEPALPLWAKAHSPKNARHLAALVLCEFLTSECSRSFPPADEKSVSQEFLKWYRQLINARAHGLVNQINEGMDNLRPILPTFVAMFEAAMKEVEAAAPA
jgi:GT2 family glycosyltransferase/tetratricopeptide (TPR) repeat protein/glycosyltransferase involved in cell wall biosynthesis